MTTVLAPALEGMQPLGFLAALGVMRVLGRAGHAISLDFAEGVARFSGPFDQETLVGALLDAAAGSHQAAEVAEDDIKMVPGLWGQRLREARQTRDSERLGFLAAWASDLVTARNGDVKPTSLDMTAGQQKFRRMFREAREAVQRNKGKRTTPAEQVVQEALFGPWRYADRTHPMGWDPWAERLHAYGAVAPTDMKGGLSATGAVWLAFEAIPLFPVFASQGPYRPYLSTSGMPRFEREPTLVWPLWRPPAGLDTVRALLVDRDLVKAGSGDRAACDRLGRRGVSHVCKSVRADLGTQGYAVLRPPEVWEV